MAITVPPVGERLEDLPLLFDHFLSIHASEVSKDPPRIQSGLLDRLLKYTWPGNVRQVNKAMEAAVYNDTDGVIEFDDLDDELQQELESEGDASAKALSAESSGPSGGVARNSEAASADPVEVLKESNTLDPEAKKRLDAVLALRHVLTKCDGMAIDVFQSDEAKLVGLIPDFQFGDLSLSPEILEAVSSPGVLARALECLSKRKWAPITTEAVGILMGTSGAALRGWWKREDNVRALVGVVKAMGPKYGPIFQDLKSICSKLRRELEAMGH